MVSCRFSLKPIHWLLSKLEKVRHEFRAWLSGDKLAIAFFGWWFGTFFIIFHSVGNIHPNWRTYIFRRGRYTTNQFWAWIDIEKQLEDEGHYQERSDGQTILVVFHQKSYSLVMANIAMENGPFRDGLPFLKWVDLSMVNWQYHNQMVPSIEVWGKKNWVSP